MEFPFTVELQDALSFSLLQPVLAALLLGGAVFAVVYTFRKYRKIVPPKPAAVKVTRPAGARVEEIRKQYLERIHKLRSHVAGGSVPFRTGYQELSKIIRMFVHEMTGIEVHNYAFSEIEMVGIPQLTALVKEYYEPEFAERSEADIMASMDRTEGVIRAWS